MVYLGAGRFGPWWFGVAWEDESFVATAIAESRAAALARVAACLPRHVASTAAPHASPFLRDAVRMLGELECGDETNKRFSLSPRHRSPARWRILSAAALVPVGFVTTYGAIARAAGSQARAVGQAMATNPLYPLVPCHRVVGADLSLVGYRGEQKARALAAKLDRLRAEARGMPAPRQLETPGLPGGPLPVVPVERVLEAVARRDARPARARRGE